MKPSHKKKKVLNLNNPTNQSTSANVDPSKPDTVLGKRIRPSGKKTAKLNAGLKSFECHLPSCGKIFSDRASLKKHMTVHGDKLF